MNDGRRTGGRRLDGYTISPPCEPNGSGELKNNMMLFVSFLNFVLCNFANVISRKVLLVEARNFYQLVEYNEKIIL